MRRTFVKSIVLLALFLAGEARPAGEKETPQRNNLSDADLPVVNSDSSSDSKEDFASFERNACLYVSPNLPACNFHRSKRSANNAEDPRTYAKNSLASVNANGRLHSANDNLTPKNNVKFLAANSAVDRFTVYKVEGCLPSRLPFNIPFCKDMESIGKSIDVQRLYPFTVGNSVKPSYVFPEFDFDAWLRTMNGVQAFHESATDDSADSNEDERSGMTPNAMAAYKHVSKGSPDVPVIGHPGTETTVNGSSEKNEVEPETEREKREPPSLLEPPNTKRSFGLVRGRAWNGNPFANTIFLEPSQNLEHVDEVESWSGVGEPIDSDVSARIIGFKDNVNDLAEEFGRLSTARVRRQSKLNNEISPTESDADRFRKPLSVERKVEFLSRKPRDVKMDSEFPYWKAMPFDPEKLTLTGVSSRIDEDRTRRTRDTLRNPTRNSLEALRRPNGKSESRNLTKGDKVRIGKLESDEGAARKDQRSYVPQKSHLKESRDKAKGNGSRVRTNLRKVGSSKLAAKYPKKKNSKNGRRSKRQ